MPVIEEIFFLPPMAVARLGGSDTPLASFTWVEDPSTHGAGSTVIQPTTTLGVQQDGSIRPFLPTTVQFRDDTLLRPVAPFFELWAKVQGQADPVRLTAALLQASGGSADAVTYRVTAANRKAARRTGQDSCAFSTQIEVLGSDHGRHPLQASSHVDPPLVSPDRPIPLGQFQVIRPVAAKAMEVDLDQLRVRFTPATGQVYGPDGAKTDIDPETNARHEMVPASHRILNSNSPWIGYDFNDQNLNSPQPSDTYDGADRDNRQSFGVVDDTCDAVIEAVAVASGVRLRAAARVFSAPPDFAPDRRPFLSLADDLIDRDPPAVDPQEEVEDALKRLADLFQRVFETASLANLDATRQRSIDTNTGRRGRNVAGTPAIFNESMTPRDQPYYRPDQTQIADATPEAPLPFADRAADVHGPLADADDLALFLRQKAELVGNLIRPPYGAFKELAANPSPAATPNSRHRDPRISRDSLHDMRMPPYMIDSDGGALSLTRRQYDLLMDLVDELQTKSGAKASPLPTATMAHVSKVLARRTKRNT